MLKRVRYAQELMKEVSAGREAHGKRPFDGEPPKSGGTTPQRKSWPGEKG